MADSGAGLDERERLFDGPEPPGQALFAVDRPVGEGVRGEEATGRSIVSRHRLDPARPISVLDGHGAGGFGDKGFRWYDRRHRRGAESRADRVNQVSLTG